MRILIAHNFYSSRGPSGENAVVQNEVALLRAGGLQVELLAVHSDNIDERGLRNTAALAAAPIRHSAGVAATKAAIQRFQPDILHVHNVYPLLSPAVVHLARRYGVPVVQTIHNYRHRCMNGLLFRDGHPCMECVDAGSAGPGIRHACYRNSRPQSVAMGVGLTWHRNTWRNLDHYIALNEFVKAFLEGNGVPADRITVRPTYIADAGAPVESTSSDVLFVGRLEQAKGILLLLESWSASDAQGRTLHIAGSGPAESEVRRAAAVDPSITYHGTLPRDAVQHLMDQCSLIALPSQSLEAGPLVLVEALSRGRPLVCNDVGGLRAMVGDAGLVVEPTVQAWVKALRIDEADLSLMKVAARRRYLDRHTPEQALGASLAVYQRALLCNFNA